VTDKRWNIMFHADEAYPSYKKFCVLNGIWV
jgi:tryptophanase